MRAQQDVGILLDEEGVLHVARRVLGREVQRREDVPVVLDLGTVGHGVAQAREDLDDLVLDERDGVARAKVLGRAGTGHVPDGLVTLGGGVAQLFAQRVDALGRLLLEAVELLSQLALELGSHRLELLHQGVQFALLAENLDAELFELGGSLGFEFLHTSEEFIDFVDHILSVFLFCVLLKNTL